MITVEQALQHIKNITVQQPKSLVQMSEALNCVLAEDIHSPINMPPFRQSAMDGYAINAHESNHYLLVGEIKAGDNSQFELKRGEAVRIFTGAPVPDSSNAVVMQEKVQRLDDNKILIDGEVKAEENIRPLGEQIQKGEVALREGDKLNPASIGFLATLGLDKVIVRQAPKVAILYTGNELVEPGTPLDYGQIYNSNSIMLQSALYELGCKSVEIHHCMDDLSSTRQKVASLLDDNEVLIVSGGISVGDYDFVKDALEYNDVEEVFYKVKQKPGKPLFFGRKDEKLIFALPGNPAAALTCFYVYLLPVIQRALGAEDFALERQYLPLKEKYEYKGGRALFLKGKRTKNGVEILEGQSSAMLHTFALADSLIYISGEKSNYDQGDLVEVIKIK
ncbi:molybdopterin molybdotransferase MoeA [Aureibacter tunicatorum]|uniref:Molybdopterin molybdenumtransferase n=1 Tax=Aureibacter tunicatorum TaxID=866807 RepID=A0AAE4BQP8_9BACT|nr:gephyrin-like molybdotransferase Glp [Aureibacter tunicatorum]MDR6237806.1 molybdopterin molybdotransferase [Aureibacter tunicatorum]BDD02841.1 molybdopterin molybdenumtransferase MoeA [Aureibacter tunicatorum]